MASKVWYVLGSAAVSPAWNGNLQDGGTAPTDAACTFGFAPGKLAISSFCQARLGASAAGATTATTSFISARSGPLVGTGSANTTAGDSFSTTLPYTGVFASGNWTFVWNMRASVAGLVGRLGMRVWASTSASGSTGTRELTSGEVFSSSLTLSATVNTNHGITWAAPAITLNNEYLFFELEYQEQTSVGSSNTDNALFRVGSSITTTNFSPQQQISATFAGAGALTVDLTQVSPSVGAGSSVTFSNNTLHYTFDGVTPPTIADTSGNSNTGTIGGTGTTVVTGKVGTNALTFDGNGTIALTDVSLLGLTTSTSEISGSCWIKTTGNNIAISSLRDAPGNGLINFTIGWNGVTNNATTLPSIIFRDSGGLGLTYVISSVSVGDNNWHHVAFTRNSSKLITLYVDGVSVGSATDTMTGALTPVLANSSIVSTIPAVVPAFVGSIDDFQYYSRALTSTEVNTIYVAGNTVATAWQGTASPAGVGSLTATANLLLAISASAFAGIGSLTAKGNLGLAAKATLAGTGALTAAGSLQFNIAAAFAGVGALSADITRVSTVVPLQGTALFAGAGSVGLGATPNALLHFDGVQGATTIADAAVPGRVWAGSITGIFRIDTAQSVFGGSSFYVDSNGYAYTTDTTLAFGTGDFTIDFWVQLDGTQTLPLALYCWSSGNAAIILTPSGALAFDNLGGRTNLGTTTVTNSVWHHIALTRASGSDRLFLDGVQQGATYSSDSISYVSDNTIVGTNGSNYTKGWFDEVRVLVGQAAWTSNFTPPSAPYSVSSAGTPLQQRLASNALWAGGGALSAAIQLFKPLQSIFAGVGAFVINEDQWFTSRATVVGTGALTATVSQLLRTTALFAGTGSLSTDVIRGINATALLAGVGGLVGDVTKLSGTVQHQGNALLAGAGALTASGSILTPLQAAFAGAGAFTISANQWFAAQAALAGVGALTVTGQVVKPLQSAFAGTGALAATVSQLVNTTALFVGVGGLTANITGITQWQGTALLAGAGSLTATGLVVKPLQAAFAGVGALSITASLQLNTAAAFAGTSALAPASLGLWLSVQAAFPGIGGLAGAALVSKPLQATFAGASTLTGTANLLSPITAALAGAGALTSSTAQWFTARTVFAGAGSLVAFATIPGISFPWPGNAEFDGLGTFSAPLQQWLASSANLSGVGSLTATTQQLVQAKGAFAGTGTFAASATLQLKTAATFAGIGGLTSAAQLLQAIQSALVGTGALTTAVTLRSPVQAAFAGVAALTASATQWLSVSTALTGAASLTADVTIGGAVRQLQGSALLTGVGVLAPVITTQWLAVNAALGGVGGLAANISGVTGWQGTATFAGLGTLTANVLQRLSASTVLSGAGSLAANLSGIGTWQGNVSFAGLGTLTATTQMLMQLRGQFGGVGALTVIDLQKPLGTAAFAGLGSLLGVARQWHAATLAVSGTGALAAQAALRLAALPTLWSGAGALTSSTIQLMNFAALLPGMGALAAQLSANFQLTALYAGAGRLTGAIVIAQQDSTNVDLIERLPIIPAMVARLQPSQITVIGQPAVAPIRGTETEPEAQITAELPQPTGIVGRTSRRVRIRTLH